jgi:hypothetical protein
MEYAEELAGRATTYIPAFHAPSPIIFIAQGISTSN